MDALEPRLPSGTIARLTEHYGPNVSDWLAQVEGRIARVARDNDVLLTGYHDAGWTSAVAVGIGSPAHPLVIKAMPDGERFRRELSALRHWRGTGVCRLIAADEPGQVLILEQVGDRPGGGPRPPDDAERVARSLSRIHTRAATPGGHVPMLVDYYRDTVIPRIRRRTATFGSIVGNSRIAVAAEYARTLSVDRGHRSMLHSDLYAENVLFEEDSTPVFIDPHATIGSPAFDWAFWCVYYDRESGFEDRVDICASLAPGLAAEAILWMVTLAIDGALYYLENNEPVAEAMLAILDSPRLAQALSGW